MIALHHGRKTKSESFASCRDRVNMSGGSKIASITVKCNGDSLSVTVPLKVKKCLTRLHPECSGTGLRRLQHHERAITLIQRF